MGRFCYNGFMSVNCIVAYIINLVTFVYYFGKGFFFSPLFSLLHVPRLAVYRGLTIILSSGEQLLITIFVFFLTSKKSPVSLFIHV